MKVMTFNLRNALVEDGANAWRYRKDFVYGYLSDSDADVICLQEVVPAVKAELSAVLSEVYACVGQGRLAEPKEYDEINLIAYKKSVFDLLHTEHFWLSETPDVAGSRYPTQLHWPRTCTHATLRAESGVYDVFATHLDNVDSAAREKGLKLILSRAKRKDKTIVCGDFNDIPENVAGWIDENFTDVTGNLSATYTEFGKTERKIDYILISKNIVRISPAVCDRQIRDGVYISDHFPVFAYLI